MKPDRIQLQMIGIPDPGQREVGESVMSALAELTGGAPDNWSLDERTALRFSQDDALNAMQRRPPRTLFLRRTTEPRYVASLGFGLRPSIRVRFDTSLERASWRLPFDLADRLSGLLQPDVATAHISEFASPWSTELEMWQHMMAMCAGLAPASYFSEGPRGLVMRTYLGPRYVEQIGEDLLFSTPDVLVTRTVWGAVCIDLAHDPWTVPQARLAAIWRRAMDHLRPSGVFARRFLAKGNNRHVNFARGKACEIPRAE